MKNLFDSTSHNEVMERLNRLSPSSHAQWGKMNVSQMLAHCKAPFSIPLNDKKMPRLLMGRLVGWMIKSKMHDESTWKQGLPTSPGFAVKDERSFDKEKEELSRLINQFHALGPTGINSYPHPFFGNFTKEQWGKMMYKHLDHHFRQFGA